MWDVVWEQARVMNWLEVGGVLTGFICVWLTVREHIACWPIGIVNVVLLFVVFLNGRLYASAALQVVFLLLQLYGWYEWLYGGPDRTEMRISRASRRLLVVAAAITVGGTAVMSGILHNFTSAPHVVLDSLQTVLSLIAQYMLSFKLVESWMFWITVDIICIGLYASAGLYLTAVLYTAYLVLATSGLLRWQRAA